MGSWGNGPLGKYRSVERREDGLRHGYLPQNVRIPEGHGDDRPPGPAADQQAQQMEFVLRKEQKEAERKRIEAQGIADFQKIVAAGISSQLLEWKGIEATEKLAASPNTKIVVIGNPKSGLPIILSGEK